MFTILMEMYKQANTDLERGVLDTLPELHAISSGLKALCSDQASKGIEVKRVIQNMTRSRPRLALQSIY